MAEALKKILTSKVKIVPKKILIISTEVHLIVLKQKRD